MCETGESAQEFYLKSKSTHKFDLSESLKIYIYFLTTSDVARVVAVAGFTGFHLFLVHLDGGLA